jgi:hypothetical protein
MGYRHHREHMKLASGSLSFNASNYRTLAIRAWNQGGVNDTLNIVSYFNKPFIHVQNMTILGAYMSNLVGYWPMTEAVYDGPNLLSPAYYNVATHVCSDPIGGFNTAATGALAKVNPISNARNGFYSYALNAPNILTVLNYNSFRFGLTSVSTWAVEFTCFPLVFNSWLVLDRNVPVSEYCGIFFNSLSQLLFLDSLGHNQLLCSIAAGWNHVLIVWDTANLITYINGVAVSTVARAAINFPLVADTNLGWNHQGVNHISHPAWYRQFPTAGVDWAGVAKQHYENQFLNYQQINPFLSSGSIASGQGWATTLDRNVAPGIPDDISFNLNLAHSFWYVEVSGEIET